MSKFYSNQYIGFCNFFCLCKLMVGICFFSYVLVSCVQEVQIKHLRELSSEDLQKVIDQDLANNKDDISEDEQDIEEPVDSLEPVEYLEPLASFKRVWRDNYANDKFYYSLNNAARIDNVIKLERAKTLEPTEYLSHENEVALISDVNKNVDSGVLLPQEEGTIEFWAKGDFATDLKSLVSDYGRDQIFLRVPDVDNTVQIAFHQLVPSTYLYSAYLPVDGDQWNFLAITWNMNSGVALVSSNFTYKTGTISNLAWRQTQALGKIGNTFNGQIKNFRVLNKALTISEILNDYSLTYKTSGEILTKAIEPTLLDKWGYVDCSIDHVFDANADNDDNNQISNFKIFLEYNDLGGLDDEWKLVPDSDLKNNSIGNSTCPFSIQKLDPLKYKKVRLKGVLSTADPYKTPLLKELKLSWREKSRIHPYVLVDNNLVNTIKEKNIDLQNIRNYVKTQYQSGLSDSSSDEVIRTKMDNFTDLRLTHHGHYVAAAMYLGIDAFFNKNELSYRCAKHYFESILAKVPNTGSSDAIAYGRTYALGVLYDWVQDTLDEDLKKRIRKYFLDEMDYIDSAYNFFTKPVFAGGHSRHANDLALPSLISIAEDIGNDDQIEQDRFNYYWGTILTNYRTGSNLVQDWITNDSGGNHQGWAYGPSYNEPYHFFAWKMLPEKDDWGSSWHQSYTYFALYGLRNGNGSLEKSKGGFDNYEFYSDTWAAHSANFADILFYNIMYFNDEYAMWMMNNLHGYGKAFYGQSYWDVLYHNFAPDVGRMPSELPLSRHFKNTGIVSIRDSWDLKENTLVTFKSTSFYSGDHQHRDQNSFTIYYKGPLAIDSGAYNAMGMYGSKHWYNYYTRTIAHNSIVVYDPSENFGTNSVFGKLSNDGGQRSTGVGYPNLAQMQEGGINHLTGIIAYEEDSNSVYAYTKGDATKSYLSTKLEKFERSLVTLRNHSYNHPVVIVYDKVISKNADFKKTYLIHSIGEPIVDAATKIIMIENTDGINASNKATLFQQTLLPTNSQLVKIGGIANNQEFYIADNGNGIPHNYNEKFKGNGDVYESTATATNLTTDDGRALREAGEWRVEISPSNNNLDDRFLNVLSITDDKETHLPANVNSLSSENFDGVIINDADNIEKTLVLFQKENTPLVNVNDTFDLTGKLIFNRIVIVGVNPLSYYNISFMVNSMLVEEVFVPIDGTLMSSDQGVVFY